MKLLIFLNSLLISGTLLSQNAFTKAILYKTDGTKMDGYVKNTTFEGTQQVFDYANENGGKITRIDAGSLIKVEFADGMVLENHYLDLVILNIALLERRITDYEFPENKVSGWFMIEKIINGTNTLYQFVDKYNFSHFYYSTTADTAIQKLEYKVYVGQDSTSNLPGYYRSGSDLIQKRDYRNQLLYLAAKGGCEKKLTPEVNRTEYRLSDMISIFKKLNACYGEQSEVNNKYLTSKPKIRFTANAGIAATNLTVPSPNQTSYPGLKPESFSSKIGPLLGVSLEIVPQKRQKNYIVSFDALYHSYTAKTDSLHPNAYITGIGHIKFSAFSFSPSVRFRLTKSTIAPFIEAGIGYRFLSKNEDYYYIKNNISSSETRREIFGGKSNSLAYFGGAGVDFKRFSIHARYSIPGNKGNTYYSTIFLMGKFILSKKAE